LAVHSVSVDRLCGMNLQTLPFFQYQDKRMQVVYFHVSRWRQCCWNMVHLCPQQRRRVLRRYIWLQNMEIWV